MAERQRKTTYPYAAACFWGSGRTHAPPNLAPALKLENYLEPTNTVYIFLGETLENKTILIAISMSDNICIAVLQTQFKEKIFSVLCFIIHKVLL